MKQWASSMDRARDRVPCLCQSCEGKLVTRYIRWQHARVCGDSSKKARAIESEQLPQSEVRCEHEVREDSCNNGFDTSANYLLEPAKVHNYVQY